MNDQDTRRGMVLVAEQLARHYGAGKLSVDVLRDVSLAVARGERVAIVGASGSGKSTLLHLLGGLDRPDAGSVSIDGVALQGLGAKAIGRLRNEKVGFVYQFHHLLPEFTAQENVAMPLLIAGMNVTEAGARAAELLARVGLGQRLEHKPSELSGGERQRAAIARAMVNRPSIILADEPTGNLDEDTSTRINELMLELNRERGTSFLVVTHDNRLAAKMDRVLRLSHGVLEAD
ncbi:MAG: lipoprotein-releasing system ATP-binding protein LolD [Gammaproteobacteria bacterium]|nr:MAG: lipoprotein-releasing system ATP-binding protein LolD [Gammaproteobacteria bacterium]PIE36343.1 MAG: lipoprotein-releasing system ATP-binding protein LolD [Gammaproteobacteria bacterium]